MKFGFWINAQYPPGQVAGKVQEHIRLARLAYSLGFDSFWAGQHFLASPYQMLQPIPLLARVAAEAPGATIGTCIILLPLYQPVLIAEELATLDILTGGRLVCGFGLGYRDLENEALGVPPQERVGRFEEALRVIEGLWRGGRFSFSGRYFRIPECEVTLLPVQRPRPPFWIAANSDQAIRRAARLGDAWMISPHSPIPVIKRQLEIYRRARAEAGLEPPAAVPIHRELYVAPTEREAWEQAERYIGPKYEAYRQWGQDRALPADDRFHEDFRMLARDRFIIGTPESVREQVERFRAELGITHLLIRSEPPGMPIELAERSLRLFGERVIPFFASQAAV